MNDQASFEACGGTISPTPSTACADIDYRDWQANSQDSQYESCTECVNQYPGEQTVIFKQKCGGTLPCENIGYGVLQAGEANSACRACVENTFTTGISTEASFKACGGASCNGIDYQDWQPNSPDSQYESCTECVNYVCKENSRCVQTVVFQQQCGGTLSCENIGYGVLQAGEANSALDGCRACVENIFTTGISTEASFKACGGTTSPTPTIDCNDIDFLDWVDYTVFIFCLHELIFNNEHIFNIYV